MLKKPMIPQTFYTMKPNTTTRNEGPAEELVALHSGSTLEAGHHLAL